MGTDNFEMVEIFRKFFKKIGIVCKKVQKKSQYKERAAESLA
jgi:hypothetical protein